MTGDVAGEELVLTAGAVARRLGVAVSTLRTWDRRYGVGASGHAPGRHRRYTLHDLAVLDRMRRLVFDGVPPAVAARLAVVEPAAAAVPPAPPAVPGPTGVRDGGGRSMPIGRAGPAARGLARAAMRLDAGECRRIIREAVRRDGVPATWEHLVVPVLVAAGRRWERTGCGVEIEHLLSGAVSDALRDIAAVDLSGGQDQAGPGSRPVLLGCAPRELHVLPLEALTAALAEASVPVVSLGAQVPAAAMRDACTRLGPAAVGVWAHHRRLARTDLLAELAAGAGKQTAVLALGPGWPSRLPVGVRRPAGLTAAVELLASP